MSSTVSSIFKKKDKDKEGKETKEAKEKDVKEKDAEEDEGLEIEDTELYKDGSDKIIGEFKNATYVRLAKCQLSSPPPAPSLPDRTIRQSTPPKKETVQLKHTGSQQLTTVTNNPDLFTAVGIASRFDKLHTLEIEECGIATLYDYNKESEKDFLNLNNLENLSLSHNQINVFPTEIQFLHKLTYLSLDHNSLENLTFPKARRQATTFKKPILKYVDLSHNNIFAIALEYEQLFQSIEKLDLSNNQLITIPIVITKLSKLVNLDISRNVVNRIPPEIGAMTSLVELFLHNNQLTTIPAQMKTLSQLKTLTLSENNLTEIPGNIFSGLINLCILRVDNNKINALPSDIRCLTKLRVFGCHGNQLTSVPSEIRQLASLTELDLSFNNLTSIPNDVAQLPKLKKLFLDHNKLSSFPPSWESSKLIYLALDNNQFRDISSLMPISSNKKLRRVSLKENPLPEPIVKYINETGALALFQLPEEQLKLVKSGDFSGLLPLRKPEGSTFGTIKNTIKGVIWKDELVVHPIPGNTNSSESPVKHAHKIKKDEKKPASFHQEPRSNVEEDPKQWFREKRSITRIGLNLFKAQATTAESNDSDSPKEERAEAMPPYDKWKDAFEKLLIDLELPAEKRQQMMDMPIDNKYKLLTSYKSNTLRNRSKSEKNTTPKYFCEILKSKEKISPDNAKSLQITLNSSPKAWMNEFIKEDGIKLLLQSIEAIPYNNLNMTEEMTEILFNHLSTLKILTKRCIQDVMSVTSPLPMATVIMHVGNPKLKIKLEVVSILNKVEQYPNIGHDHVWEAMQTYGKIRHLINFQAPFVQILQITQSPTDLSEKRKSKFEDLEEKVCFVPLKAVCLSLINHMLNNIDDLESRYIQRAYYHTVGIQPLLKYLRSLDKTVSMEIDTFLEGLKQDEEELPERLGKSELVKLDGLVREQRSSWDIMLDTELNASLNVTNRRGAIMQPLTKVQEKVVQNYIVLLNNSALSSTFSIRIPFDAKTTVKSLYDSAIKGLSIPDSIWSRYDIVVNMKGSFEKKTIVLEPTKTISSYNLSGEIICEIKAKPVKVRLHLEYSNRDLDKSLSPDSLIGEIVSDLLNEFKPPQEDYGLFYFLDWKNNFWLEETEKLASYDLIHKGGVLKLKIKPKPFRIMCNGVWKVVMLDSSLEVGRCTTQLAQEFAIPKERVKDYAITIITGNDSAFHVCTKDDFNKKVKYLDENKKLSDFKLNKMENLHFMARLRPIRLQYLDGKTDELFLDFSTMIYDLLDELRSIKDFPEDTALYMIPKAGPHIWLESHQTLRDRVVPDNATLCLKQRKDLVKEGPRELSVWEEPTSPETITIGPEGNVTAGTLNKLVEFMTNDTKDSENVTKIVICNHPCFTTSIKLLEKLLERYRVPPNVDETLKFKIQTKVCEVLEYWKSVGQVLIPTGNTQINALDEISVQEDKKTLNLSKLANRGLDNVSALSKRIRHDITAELRKTQSSYITIRKKDAMQNLKSEDSSPNLEATTPQRKRERDDTKKSLRKPLKIINDDLVVVFEIYRKEIAKQLTKSTFEIYTRIMNTEFFKQSWSKPKTQHLSPNILQMIGIFNKVSNWVSACILLEPTIRRRATIMTSFIRISQQLRKLNNFHLLVAFVSGINNSAIQRLKWTIKKIPSKYLTMLKELETVMSMEGSFKVYRENYKATTGPCIPYIGVSLQDLTFVDENSDMRGQMINFDKQRMTYNIISEALKAQNNPYPDDDFPEIQMVLEKLPSLSDKELFEKSLEIEPRGATRVDIK